MYIYGVGINFGKSKETARTAAQTYKSTLARHEATTAIGGTITEAMEKDLKTASHNLKNAHLELQSARGDIFGSVLHMFNRMGEAVGIRVSGKATAEFADKTMLLASEGRVGIVERTLSKPFRVAAKYPKVALAVGAIAAAVGIGSAASRRAEQRTQDDLMQQAMMAQQQSPMQVGASAQANTTYQISPEEYALLQARMRGGDGSPQTGHAESVIAAREAAAAQGAPVAASV